MEIIETDADPKTLETIGTALVDFLTRLGWTNSRSEGRRLIQQGGIRLNDLKIHDPFARLARSPNKKHTFQIIQRMKPVPPT